MKAAKNNKLQWAANADDAFISKGYCKEMTDKICLKEITNNFVAKSEHRLNFFGKF